MSYKPIRLRACRIASLAGALLALPAPFVFGQASLLAPCLRADMTRPGSGAALPLFAAGALVGNNAFCTPRTDAPDQQHTI